VAATTAPNHVIWSVTGAAHVDNAMLRQTVRWVGAALSGAPLPTAREEADFEFSLDDYGQDRGGLASTCAGAGQFPRRYAVYAALGDLQAWLATGHPAPSAPPFRFSPLGTAAVGAPLLPALPDLPTQGVNGLGLLVAPLALVRDGSGVAVGGLRLPVVIVPVAAYDGAACVLLGTSRPLSPSRLRAQYPDHNTYVGKLWSASWSAVAHLYLTRADAFDLLSGPVRRRFRPRV
jgi:hypothetical protein